MASFFTPCARARVEIFIWPSGSPRSAGMPTRLAITSATPGMLAQPPQIRICSGCLAAGAGGEVELQRAAHLLAHVVDERVEHLGLVVGRQPAFLLGASRLLHAEAVRPHDFLGQLLAAEGEVARIGDLEVAQHRERRAAGTEVDDGDVALHAAVRHLVREQPARVFEGEGLDVDDAGGEPGGLHGCLALLDVLGARRHEQHVEHVGIFLGRADDLEVVAHLFHRTMAQIVTVTGPGGMGKSRVAVQVARTAIPAFPDGVFHVDLANAGDVEIALRGVAEVLGLPPSAAETPLDQLIAHARHRRLLLVLDTADRVAGLGSALGALAAASSTAATLVTSRSPLRVAAEHEYPLGPLASRIGGTDPGPAVALFLERARAVRPDLAVGPDDLATIAAICDRVDGLPLAIELAAARVRVLSLAAILARLQRLLPVLTGGAADAPARQRTLRDTIAWSYGLLDADEQSVLQRLAVFASSFDQPGAEAIIGPGPDLLGALERLVDRSLLVVTPTEAEPRFRLLGAIREFALEMLDASAVAATVREAHARHVLDVVDRETAAVGSPCEAAALAALDREADDAHAALSWALDEPVDPARAELAIRLVGRLGRYWWLRGRVREGSAWLERALVHGESAPPPARAAALYWAGILLDDRGDPEAADRRLTAALAIQRDLGDDATAARTLNSLGAVAHSLGDSERAERLLRESLALKDRRGLQPERASTLHNLAAVAAGRGRYGDAIALYEEALHYDAQAGAHGAESFSRVGLGAVRIMAGDDARGAADVRAALPQLAALGGRATRSRMRSTRSARPPPTRAGRIGGPAPARRRRAAGA